MTTYSTTHEGLDRVTRGFGVLYSDVLVALRKHWQAWRTDVRQRRQDAMFREIARTDWRVEADLRAAIARSDAENAPFVG